MVLGDSKSVQNELNKIQEEESIGIRTVRSILNLLTHILLMLTNVVCFIYSMSTFPNVNVFQLHVILCVLGYQFFMCQGTLALSKYNSWSMILKRRHKIRLHWLFQVIGFVLVAVGSISMCYRSNFSLSSSHGITGFCALLVSLLGMINGLPALYAFKMSSYVSPIWIKFFHYFAGIGTLFMSAASLCLGFNYRFFRDWAGNDHVNLLIIFTCVFTVLVAMDSWLASYRRIRNVI